MTLTLLAAKVLLPELAKYRHPQSWGLVTVEACPNRVVTVTTVDGIDDAIGMLATALGKLLAERAVAEKVVRAWMPTFCGPEMREDA